MAIEWVAGSLQLIDDPNFTYLSITRSAPAGIQDDDVLLAAVFGRSALTTPTGWTKIAETDAFNLSQRVAVFSKTTVTSSDASASFTFSQASFDRIGLVYAVLRGVESLEATLTTIVSSTATWEVTPSSVTATVNGEMAVVFGSTVNNSGAMTVSPPTLFTLTTSGSATEHNRLACAYRVINAGQSTSGAFDFDSADVASPWSNGLGAISLRYAPASTPPTNAHLALTSPVGTPSILARIHSALLIALASPVGAARAIARHDFTGHIDAAAATRYVMDMVTPSGLMRVPISSWQATLQTAGMCYVQCVIPASSEWGTAITDATEFVVSRVATFVNGQTLEYEMARAPASLVTLYQSHQKETATISGYTAALSGEDNPPAVYDRLLTGVRLVTRQSGNTRIRCAIDWLLRPGHRAYLDAEPIIVAFINYYVSVDQYMDIGD